MVCNVTTFSYNRGPSGGALYLGNIGSLKDRCVSDTCDEKILGSLLRHQFHLWNPWGACSGSGSRKPEVKIFRNERFRLIRRFRTRYGRTEIRPDIFLGSLLGCPFHIRKPSSPRSGSVSRRPEVKIFRNERFRLIRRFSRVRVVGRPLLRVGCLRNNLVSRCGLTPLRIML